MKVYKPIDMAKVKASLFSEGTAEISSIDFASVYKKGMSFIDFVKTFPRISKGTDIIELAKRLIEANHRGKNIVLLLGSDVFKWGLTPIITDAIETGLFNAVAIDGKVLVNDFQVADSGAVSGYNGERDKDFATPDEIGKIINNVFKNAFKTSFGAGKSMSSFIKNSEFRYKTSSILCTAECYQVPVTVHISVGTDMIYQLPNCDGAAVGRLSLIDFRLLACILKDINDGGVVLNFGASAALTEVFINALKLSRSAGDSPAAEFYIADFVNQSSELISDLFVGKGTTGGKFYEFIGMPYIMIPILLGMAKELFNNKNEE